MNGIAFGDITWLMIIAQGIGFFGIFMNVLSFQQNTNKGIVGVQILGATFFCIHFILLGMSLPGNDYTGAALNGLGIARNTIFFCRPKKWASSTTWVYIFCISYVIAGILTWETFISLLPIIAMISGTISLYIVNPKLTRRLSLVCSAGWIIYNVLSSSIPGVIGETLTIISIITAMIKFDIKKQANPTLN